MTELNLELLKTRDEQALRSLFDTVYPKLVAMARQYRGSSADVDDMVQAALVKIFAHIDKAPIESADQLLRWCSVVMRNTMVDQLRMSRKQQLECRYFEDEAEDLASVSSPPMADLALHETIQKALLELPETDQQLISLRMAGMTFQEIAEKMQISERTLYRKYHFAVEHVRKCLESELEGK